MEAIFYSTPINKVYYKSDEEKKEGNHKTEKKKKENITQETILIYTLNFFFI